MDDDRARGPGQFAGRDQAGDGAGRHRLPVRIDDEAPVGVAVEREPDVGPLADDRRLQIDQVGRFERVRLMVGKAAVELEVHRHDRQRQRLQHGVAEDSRHGIAAHAVRRINDDPQWTNAAEINQRAQVLGIVAKQVEPVDARAPSWGSRRRRGRPAPAP